MCSSAGQGEAWLGDRRELYVTPRNLNVLVNETLLEDLLHGSHGPDHCHYPVTIAADYVDHGLKAEEIGGKETNRGQGAIEDGGDGVQSGGGAGGAQEGLEM